MKYSTAALALVAGANAHTLFSELYVDGKAQGDGTCIREPTNPVGAVDPITDLGSSDMACGQDGTIGVARTCSVNGGSSLTFEYRQWPDDVSKGPLAEGHMGPCSVYLKKVANATADSGAGDGWFKLWDEGYDESSGKWCTQQMIANNGRITVYIPDSLAGGDYLVRPELLALHNIPVKGTPEFYVGCAQIYLESFGSSGPESTVSIPGYVSGTDGATTYNAFDQPLKLPYPMPGPDVYTSASTGSMSVNSKQADGLIPADCILTNANWCGVELPDFSDEDGCWAADKVCWAQLDQCYDSAPPTGSANCKIWEQKCKDNQGVCNSGSPSGPANKGKVLTPDPATIEVPAAVNAGANYGSASNAKPASSASVQASSSAAPAPSTYSSAAAASSAAPSQPSYENNEKESSVSSPPSSAAAAAAVETPAADAPVESSESASTTTLATQYATAPAGGAIIETVYDVVTVTTDVYVTATAAPPAPHNYGHRRHHKHGRR